MQCRRIPASSLASYPGLASNECCLFRGVFHEPREEPLKRPLLNLIVEFSSPFFLQDCEGAPILSEDPGTAETRSCIARMTSALAKSWSAIGNSPHPGCVFCLHALQFGRVANTSPRKVSRRLLGGNTRVSAATIPKGKPHSKGTSTSP